MGSLEEKQYKRCEHMIDKIKGTFPNWIYNKKQEQELVKNELIRHKNFPQLAEYDYTNIGFLICVSLLGLNKESIERNEKHNNYELSVRYKEIMLIESTSNKSPFYKQWLMNINNAVNTKMSENKIENTPYDEWLSVKNIKMQQTNYMFNIRNSLMHSEYNIDILEGLPLLANIFNSNYTGFEATVYIPKFLEFMKSYFSNDAFYGVVDNLFLIDLEEDINIKNDPELILFLKEQVKVINFKYENKIRLKKFEKVILNNPQIPTKKLIKKYNIETTETLLDDEQINQIVLNLRNYYGDKLYSIEKEELERIITEAIRYKLNPKEVISCWMMHFYNLFSAVSRFMPLEEDFISGFALKPTLLLLESYNVLYRLQNKELQNLGLDYNLMNNIEYNYDIKDYDAFCNKLVEKGTYVDEFDSKKKFFTEIFRNTLAHGNIDFFYKETGDTIEEYIKFDDIHKTKKRSIRIRLNEFDRYLSSECFESSQLKQKSVDKEETTRKSL